MSAELIKIVQDLNTKITSLNNERNRKLGIQEAAKNQYDKALQAYEQKYGVKITEANLQAEYNSVYADVKGRVLATQELIGQIESGAYKHNSKVLDIDLEPNVEVVKPVLQAVEQSTSPSIPEPTSFVAPEPTPFIAPAPTVETKVIPEPTSFVAPTNEQPTVAARPLGGLDFSALAETSSSQKVVLDTPILSSDDEVEVPSFGGGFSLEPEQPKVTEPIKTPEPTKTPDMPIFGGGLGIPTPKVDESSEEDTITPADWGSPKSTDDMNKSFESMLSGSAIKFGE